MNKAKSHKIAILFCAFLICITAAFSFMFAGVRPHRAATAGADSTADYFSGVENVSFDNGAVKVIPAEGETLEFENRLAADDLEIELSVSGIASMKIILTSDAFYANGNKNADGGFDAQIDNVLEIEFTSGGATVYFNDAEKASGQSVSFGADEPLSVTFTSEDNMLTAGLNGVTVACADEYYKIAGGGVCAATVSIEATAADGETAEYSITAVDQKASDESGDYRQTFTVTDGKIEAALPVVALGGDFLGYENSLKVYDGIKYNVPFTLYSVLGGITSSDVYLGVPEGEEDISLYNSKDKPKDIQFNATGTKTFNALYEDGDEIKTLATFTATVYDRESDSTAPVYDVSNTAALEAFEDALMRASLVNYGEEDEHSIALGGELTIPSLKDLVSDDTTMYEDLTHTVYYRTPSGSGSVTDWDIPVNSAGEYRFYVVFEDEGGNTMLEEDFFTEDEDDGNIITPGRYYAFYFTFYVRDDAPISVLAVEQGTAYLGIEYVAADFNIESSGYNAVYELYYNPDANASIEGENWEESWALVPEASSASEDDEFAGGLSYDDVSAINYDGELTFTPGLSGSYAIKCTVDSTSSVRSASAETVIRVSEDVTTVKPASHWLENNVWSVVFLSIGTLCLIGIVILLFVKPKEEQEESTGEEIKK